MPPVMLPAEAGASLEQLATHLGLDNFDLLLAADGSGTVYGHPAGWACVAYDRARSQVGAVAPPGKRAGGESRP